MKRPKSTEMPMRVQYLGTDLKGTLKEADRDFGTVDWDESRVAAPRVALQNLTPAT